MVESWAQKQNKIDFVGMFNKRFNSVPVNRDSFAREIALTTGDIEIDLVRRRVPVVVFTCHRETPYYLRDAINGLWMESAAKLSSDEYPHKQIEKLMRTFLAKNSLHGSRHASAYLFQNGSDQRHLVLDAQSTNNVNEQRGYFPDDTQKFWVSLAQRYDISTILGNFELWDYATNSQIKFVDSELIGKIREDEYIFKFARDRNMTITQFLRFRTLTRAALEFRKERPLTPYKQVADEVIAFDNPDPLS